MEYLLDAICRKGSTCQIWCEHCGRTHFLDGPYKGDYDEDELEKLLKKHKEQPDKYILREEFTDDAISWGEFCGKQIVHGCPCNEKVLRDYVDHYWSHRRIIAEFLKARARAEADTNRTRAVILDAISDTAGDALDFIVSLSLGSAKE